MQFQSSIVRMCCIYDLRFQQALLWKLGDPKTQFDRDGGQLLGDVNDQQFCCWMQKPYRYRDRKFDWTPQFLAMELQEIADTSLRI